MLLQQGQISVKDVEEAVKLIDSNQEQIKTSTLYDVIINNKPYPPKSIRRIAHKLATGKELGKISGGPTTNRIFEKLGFEIVRKKRDNDPHLVLIERYKKIIAKTQNKDEIYKWQLLATFQGRPDTSATDFYEEIRTIIFKNLIYYFSFNIAVLLSKIKEDEFRDCFKNLYNENLLLKDRIYSFSSKSIDLLKEVDSNQKLNAFQDERTIATYLTFHNPTTYTFFKNSFYQKYCKHLNIPSKKKGEKYVHYLELVKSFIENYIEEDEELLELKSSFLPDGAFSDSSNLIFAQDILYQTLDLNLLEELSYWRIGTTERNENRLPEMLSNNHISIGWSDLGDLTNLDTNDRNEIIGFFQRNKYYDNKSLESRKAGEIINFFKHIKIGDIVAVQNGYNVLGIAKVTDEYVYNPEFNFPHLRPVKWLVHNVNNFSSAEGSQTTVYPIKNLLTIEKINQLINEEIKLIAFKQDNMWNKNTILYGPPGTGKTYNSIEVAVEIASGNRGKTYEESKSIFDQLRKEGQIDFVTFHQNYSYEDFVSGIKPDIQNGEQLIFKKQEGVFYKIYKRALENYNLSLSSKEIFKESFEEVFEREIMQPLAKSEPVSVKMTSGVSFNIFDISDYSLSFEKPSKGKDHTLSINTLKTIFEGNRTMQSGLAVYYYPLVDLLKSKQKIKDGEEVKRKKYVLIIDEINRANISKVFGELITLLEDDKRLGQPNALTVRLQNGEEICLPPNLYIVGTMNTADKSIALVDVALRRRFDFKGYYPTHDVIDKLVIDRYLIPEAAKLLKDLNAKIYEKKNSAEYLIGHAYLIHKKLEELPVIMQQRFVPLLMEYFSGKKLDVEDVLKNTDYKFEYNDKSFQWNPVNASVRI